MNEDKPATATASASSEAGNKDIVVDGNDNPVAKIEQEIADEIAANVDEPSGAAQLFKLKFRVEKEGLRYKVEAIARDCFAFAIATSLAVFGIRVVVPPALRGSAVGECCWIAHAHDAKFDVRRVKCTPQRYHLYDRIPGLCNNPSLRRYRVRWFVCGSLCGDVVS
jgi:hypothetical protein